MTVYCSLSLTYTVDISKRCNLQLIHGGFALLGFPRKEILRSVRGYVSYILLLNPFDLVGLHEQQYPPRADEEAPSTEIPTSSTGKKSLCSTKTLHQ